MIRINNSSSPLTYSKPATLSSESQHMPSRPPQNGAILQSYNVQRDIFINITPESNGNMSVDVISPKNHEILEHHSINPMEVNPSNASYLEMLALEQHLYSQGKCEQLLSGFFGILYENEGLNEKANHLEELKTSMDYFLKDNTFDMYLKNRQATYEILNWRPRTSK